jgi:nucleotide-binding universal stress UspA family protein
VVRPILVVSGLTHASDEALRAAARLATASGAALHVVHCAGLVGMPLREVLPLLETAPAALLAGRLGEQIRRALPDRQAGGAVPRVEYRPAPQGTLHARHAVDAGLVVVGTDASGTAALPALVAAAQVPVLVVRDAAPPPFERVLVPLGPADLAGGTLRLACEWLRPLEHAAVLPEMHVLHVSRRLADWRGIGDRFEAEVRAVEEGVRRMGGVFHRHVRWSGAPWPAIVAASRELVPDLVVLRPGRGPARDPRAGRTWTAVVEQARSNVLLLPGAAPGPADPAAAECAGTIEPFAADAEREPVPA